MSGGPKAIDPRLVVCSVAGMTGCEAAREKLSAGGAEFVARLAREDMAAWWHWAAGLPMNVPPVQRPLAAARMNASARYLAQRRALACVDSALGAAGIPYAVFKGAAVREMLLECPEVLECSDIDVLVAPSNRSAAVAALCAAGFVARLDSAGRNISHEITLSSELAGVDLHWDVLRPGRLRADLVEPMLARRVRLDGFWAACEADALLLMLVHPAFAKHVCSRDMGLVRVAAFLAAQQRWAACWESVRSELDRLGARTAAWTMLGWYQRFASGEQQRELLAWREQLRPGPLRAAWLAAWLALEVPRRLTGRRWLVQVGMLPLLHDTPADVWKALSGWRRARRTQAAQLDELRRSACA